jgi:hypothetical protein
MSVFSPFHRPYRTPIFSNRVIPAINRWATLTCPYGASMGMLLTSRLETHTMVQIPRKHIFVRPCSAIVFMGACSHTVILRGWRLIRSMISDSPSEGVCQWLAWPISSKS